MTHRPHAPTTATRARRISIVVVVLFILSSSVALAWTIGTTNPGNSITAATLGGPGVPTAVPTPLTGPCTSVLVSWTAATNADRYRVEVDTGTGYTTLVASHTTTSYTDATGYANQTATYRITPLVSTGANWTGTPATVAVTCGIGNVSDLVATQGCAEPTLTWSAASGAARYEVWVSVNGAPATALTTNLNALTYTDTAIYTAGDSLAYQVRPRNGATLGNFSNTSTIASWTVLVPFRVVSIVAANTGALGTLNAGDTVTVTFSKPVSASTVTATQLQTSASGGPTRGLWLAATTTAIASTDIGRINVNGLFSNAAANGTVGWNLSRTVWTWTASGAGPTMSGPLTGTFVAGTSAAAATCAGDGVTVLDTTTGPALSGQW